VAAHHRKIRNPFVGHGEYHCFGCDPDNPIGLKLAFTLEGDRVTAIWEPRTDLEGYPGVIHGGIQATLLDEIAAWYVYAVMGRAGVTRRLTVEYARPAQIARGPFSVEGWILREDRKSALIGVSLADSSGSICSKGEVELAVFGDEIGRRRFSYPGQEAFFYPEE
jgi:acyl-coenzyme A thioesterase PaaI-like protein